MVDTTQPASPAEFISAGATPEQAEILRAQHEIMAGRGKGGGAGKFELSHAIRNQLPPSKPEPPASTITPTQAVEAAAAHEAAQLEGEFSAIHAPATSHSDFKYPVTRLEALTDEEAALDRSTGDAMAKQGLTKRGGNNVLTDLASWARKSSGETPDQRQARIDATADSLYRMWGKEYAVNMGVFQGLLARMRSDPALSRYVDLAHALEPTTINDIVETERFRARKR